MYRDYRFWWSGSLHRIMEMLVFGHAGTPVLVFPTSMGRFFEWEGFGMIDALRPQLEGGHNRLYCLDSVDSESFYSPSAPPWARIARHEQYDRYVAEEVLPHIAGETGTNFLIVTGASFGAYHAANFAFRYPQRVGKLIAMGGCYDIKRFLGDYYSDAVYFHNPVDYLANLTDPHLLGWLRRQDIRLAVGEHDFCRGSTEYVSSLLYGKGVGHQLDIWYDGAGHDWPWWRGMIAKHIV